MSYPPPQQPPYGPQPMPQPMPMQPAYYPPQPPKKKTALIVAISVIVIVVVVVAVLAVVLLGGGGSPLIGKWNIKSVESGGTSVSTTGTIEFKSDGTCIMTMTVYGMTQTSTGKWKDLGGGKVEFEDKNGVKSTANYIIEGNRLTLTDSSGSKIICERA